MAGKILAPFAFLFLAAVIAAADPTPPTALLVLNKGDTSLAIIDPISLKIVGKAFSGQDPHEVVASADGKLAISIIDGAKKELAQTLTIPTRSANRLKFTPDGKLVLISDLGGSGLFWNREFDACKIEILIKLRGCG